MKTLQHNRTKKISRVKDDLAFIYVHNKDTHTYVPKSVWKSEVRDAVKNKEDKKDTKKHTKKKKKKKYK